MLDGILELNIFISGLVALLLINGPLLVSILLYDEDKFPINFCIQRANRRFEDSDQFYLITLL